MKKNYQKTTSTNQETTKAEAPGPNVLIYLTVEPRQTPCGVSVTGENTNIKYRSSLETGEPSKTARGKARASQGGERTRVTPSVVTGDWNMWKSDRSGTRWRSIRVKAETERESHIRTAEKGEPGSLRTWSPGRAVRRLRAARSYKGAADTHFRSSKINNRGGDTEKLQ